MDHKWEATAASSADVILDASAEEKASERNADTEKYARVMRPNDQLNVTPIEDGDEDDISIWRASPQPTNAVIVDIATWPRPLLATVCPNIGPAKVEIEAASLLCLSCVTLPARRAACVYDDSSWAGEVSTAILRCITILFLAASRPHIPDLINAEAVSPPSLSPLLFRSFCFFSPPCFPFPIFVVVDVVPKCMRIRVNSFGSYCSPRIPYPSSFLALLHGVSFIVG